MRFHRSDSKIKCIINVRLIFLRKLIKSECVKSISILVVAATATVAAADAL